MMQKSPIFIVGCGHSGTSLTLAILGAHSKIYAIPYESSVAFMKPEIAQLQLQEFDEETLVNGKERWVEKTPMHIHRIAKILGWYPATKILLITRDGRDVACSLQDRMGNLEMGIRHWVHENLASRAYWTHPNIYIFKYEALIDDFECTLKGILEFIDEDYEFGMKDFHKEPHFYYSETIEKPPTAFGAYHNQYRNWQINQPLFDGRGRWKRLSSTELSLVERIGGEMLSELGYASAASLIVKPNIEIGE